MFSFACSDGGQSLRDDTIFMLAGYNNLSSGPDSYSYSIGLNTETKEGFFNLHIMGQDSESSLDIVLTDEDVEALNEEISNVRFKDCIGEEGLTGSASKYVQFQNVEPVAQPNSIQIRELDEDSDEYILTKTVLLVKIAFIFQFLILVYMNFLNK